MSLPHRLNRRQRGLLVGLALIVTVLAVPPLRRTARTALTVVAHRLQGKQTVAQRLDQYGPAARARLAPYFRRAAVSYPPSALAFVGLKHERRLEVCARNSGAWRLIRSYPIIAASGKAGPKLREGDMQVPEGVYEIESLNPNSLYHLALRISYPNDFDRARAAEDGRDKLGGDIMIHGSNGSVGCLAMGDVAAEELFVLAADTGIRRTQVILAPLDFRRRGLDMEGPPWLDDLYRQVREELADLPSQ
jgi:hypothetical protein